MKTGILLATLLAASVLTSRAASIHGDYLEVRTCDIYTGPCFANAEMGLTGKEAILTWAIREGTWNGTQLNGLKVIAVVRTDTTMGDQAFAPRAGKAVVIVDSKADAKQREALVAMVRAAGGKLISEVAEIKSAAIETNIGNCTKAGCASVKAADLVAITTRCFGDKDHVCGNETTFYPPLTKIAGALPAFTEVARYAGTGLNVTFTASHQRSAFLGTFSI
ncbi:MAG: DUF1326 domain-containing protein [Verrucomicrobia bacterium]|nr:DUF1326 domain-containing protein [Verrucomicrobiota bacterium]